MLTPGFNLVNPCSEEVMEIDMKIQLANAGTHSFITKDNVKVTVKSSLAYRVVNPVLVQYRLANQLLSALSELTAAALRNAVGEHMLDDVLSNRSKIVGQAKEIVKAGLPPGIDVDRIFM